MCSKCWKCGIVNCWYIVLHIFLFSRSTLNEIDTICWYCKHNFSQKVTTRSKQHSAWTSTKSQCFLAAETFSHKSLKLAWAEKKKKREKKWFIFVRRARIYKNIRQEMKKVEFNSTDLEIKTPKIFFLGKQKTIHPRTKTFERSFKPSKFPENIPRTLSLHISHKSNKFHGSFCVFHCSHCADLLRRKQKLILSHIRRFSCFKIKHILLSSSISSLGAFFLRRWCNENKQINISESISPAHSKKGIAIDINVSFRQHFFPARLEKTQNRIRLFCTILNRFSKYKGCSLIETRV